jgi:D-tyrosyl-tRNA(Tyr) deacylase
VRAVVQRVSRAEVRVDGEVVGSIGHGMLVLLGVSHDDDESVCDRLADKVRALRIFADAEGRMNEPLGERGVLVVSQFTLYGDCQKGRRPSFIDAARPEAAEPLYRAFADAVRLHGVPVATGRFGADMQVELVNDGPVTLVLDTAEPAGH